MAVMSIRGPRDREPQRVGVTHAITTIGRGLANTVVLRQDPRVSLRHATLVRTSSGYVVRDEGSANGTWVNGDRVGERLLRDGDQLQLGDTIVVFNPAA